MQCVFFNTLRLKFSAYGFFFTHVTLNAFVLIVSKLYFSHFASKHYASFSFDLALYFCIAVISIEYGRGDKCLHLYQGLQKIEYLYSTLVPAIVCANSGFTILASHQ